LLHHHKSFLNMGENFPTYKPKYASLTCFVMLLINPPFTSYLYMEVEPWPNNMG
jgi:hypothetical protein